MSTFFSGEIFKKLNKNNRIDKVNDKTYLKIVYLGKVRKFLRLKNPKTYSEKLQWLKLNDHNPLYTTLVDKYELKKWVDEKIGKGHTVKTLGLYNNVGEIDLDRLPNQFVLKCTHNSGGLVICKDKQKKMFYTKHNEPIEWAVALDGLKESLNFNYYYYGREWPYKNVPPRIIAEEYLVQNHENKEETLSDYKYFCFNGEPKIMYISKDSDTLPHTDFFDMDFNHLNIKIVDENSSVLPEKPKKFDEMKEFAAKLSQGIPHVRVDFYCLNDTVYVGELTFYHGSGFITITPDKWNYEIGSWIDCNLAYNRQNKEEK